jgi:hypothetical protein
MHTELFDRNELLAGVAVICSQNAEVDARGDSSFRIVFAIPDKGIDVRLLMLIDQCSH